jgi:choline dehydrogenase-like flavoprotein
MVVSKPLEKVDVVIVGAGAAGSVFAAKMAEAGKSVLVLDNGPARKLADLYSSQIWARRLKWATPYVKDAGPDSIWFNFNAGNGFGGAAIHHYGVWPRFHPEDFKEKSLYGKGLDWPIDYDDLRPWYDRIQREVGVSGDAKAEIWRPSGDPYPLPPVMVNTHGETLAKGFAALGMHTAPLPMAVLTEAYNGRPACIWDGWCDAGCPIGALANPLVVYLPKAKKHGARLQGNARVTRIRLNKTGDKALGVEYFSKGKAHFQAADMVVLAAFPVENARILLNSATSNQPRGAANSSGLVGHYITTHPSVAAYGMFDGEMENYMGATGGQLLNQDSFAKTGHPGFGSRQWAIAQALKPNDLLGIGLSRNDLFGTALQDFMQKATRSLGVMIGICEDQPILENRIELSPKKDENGFPLAQVHYQASPDGIRLFNNAAEEGVKVMKAAGATEAWCGPRGAQHLMGGTIMGTSPETSVANRSGQAHDLPNLFIGGAGLFPTSSAVNSTFTLHALAALSADFAVRHWGSFTA